MHRRTFIQSTLGAVVTAPVAASEISVAEGQEHAAQPSARSGIRLGFDSWTLHDYGWTATQYLDYAASQRLDTVQLSDLFNYASLEPAYLKKVKDQAQRLGLQIDGGLGCICPTARNWKLEPDYRKAFPKARASEFARFVGLARRGHPFMASMLIGAEEEQSPPAYAAAFKEQQRLDLERSLDYAKNVLKLGLRSSG